MTQLSTVPLAFYSEVELEHNVWHHRLSFAGTLNSKPWWHFVFLRISSSSESVPNILQKVSAFPLLHCIASLVNGNGLRKSHSISFWVCLSVLTQSTLTSPPFPSLWKNIYVTKLSKNLWIFTMVIQVRYLLANKCTSTPFKRWNLILLPLGVGCI